MGLQGYLIVSAILFGIGMFGFLARRNAILMLISIELMLNAVNPRWSPSMRTTTTRRMTAARSSPCW